MAIKTGYFSIFWKNILEFSPTCLQNKFNWNMYRLRQRGSGTLWYSKLKCANKRNRVRCLLFGCREDSGIL